MPQLDAENPDPDSLLLRRVRRQNQRRSAARFAFRGGAREVWRMKKNSDSANRFLGHGWAGGRVSWAAGPAHVDLAETAGASLPHLKSQASSATATRWSSRAPRDRDPSGDVRLRPLGAAAHALPGPCSAAARPCTVRSRHPAPGRQESLHVCVRARALEPGLYVCTCAESLAISGPGQVNN